MEVICLEDAALYKLIEELYLRLKESEKQQQDIWISGEAAMAKLGITSKTSLQKLRDQGKIRFSQPQKKVILYDVISINEYLEKHAKNTF